VDPVALVQVHQILSGAGPVDAVTTQARRWRERFTAWGWGGRDVAVHIDPRMDGAVRPIKELRAAPRDVLLVHYSAYAPKLRGLLDLPNPTLLLSHNVTPARWFWDFEPTIAIHCALGRRQLPEFAARADLVAGVSAYNARELGSQTVIPILFDPARLGAPAATAPPGPPRLLFVGRLAPHKRQDELIRVLALLRRNRLPDARLTLVGEPLTPRYLQQLEQLAQDLAPGAVTFASGLSTAELAERYREAHAFVSLSEHEGFCIPLLEAFHMGVPVVARPAGGVPEVAGDAALLAGDRDDAVLAELVAIAIEDDALRRTLQERGRERLGHFGIERAEHAMRSALEALVR
jgi:glycosyltransferase involved in cell wall biosynthesis